MLINNFSFLIPEKSLDPACDVGPEGAVGFGGHVHTPQDRARQATDAVRSCM